MSNLISPLCGVGIRLATASQPVCVMCVWQDTTYLANMFHPKRQGRKASSPVEKSEPFWRWRSSALKESSTAFIAELLWILGVKQQRLTCFNNFCRMKYSVQHFRSYPEPLWSYSATCTQAADVFNEVKLWYSICLFGYRTMTWLDV